MKLSDQVATTLRRRIRLPRGARVLAAVSGGADSVALAWLLAELSERGELVLVGLGHLNHQLRGLDADADEAFVAALMAGGAGFLVNETAFRRIALPREGGTIAGHDFGAGG